MHGRDGDRKLPPAESFVHEIGYLLRFMQKRECVPSSRMNYLKGDQDIENPMPHRCYVFYSKFSRLRNVLKQRSPCK